ncbi:hypothetical protein TNCT_505431 [Trichonephila clavata]|uniref:Uncharacterized protein n=1 Tax=Trichonephila clavata TaxID=2740835 RepID=A0A8X6LMD3_TRICU|nr:hypothetical protein TNCT_505431 [Trichonephila clavata]
MEDEKKKKSSSAEQTILLKVGEEQFVRSWRLFDISPCRLDGSQRILMASFVNPVGVPVAQASSRPLHWSTESVGSLDRVLIETGKEKK